MHIAEKYTLLAVKNLAVWLPIDVYSNIGGIEKFSSLTTVHMCLCWN